MVEVKRDVVVRRLVEVDEKGERVDEKKNKKRTSLARIQGSKRKER